MFRVAFFLMFVLMLAPMAAPASPASPGMVGVTAGIPQKADGHLMGSCTPYDQVDQCSSGQTCNTCSLLCNACHQAAMAAQLPPLAVVVPATVRPRRITGDYLSAEHSPNFKPPIL